MKNELLNRLIELLLKKDNKKKLYRFLTKYYVCIIKVETTKQQLTLYNFFKRIGIKIQYQEKYESGEWPLKDLMDIWFYQKEPYEPIVDMEPWHILQSNITRKRHSIKLEDFESIIKCDPLLFEIYKQ